jgi:hypothetical protein
MPRIGAAWHCFHFDRLKKKKKVFVGIVGGGGHVSIIGRLLLLLWVLFGGLHNLYLMDSLSIFQTFLADNKNDDILVVGRSLIF